MPNINLIADRRAEQLRMVRLTRNLFLALSTSVAIFISVALFLAAQHVAMEGDLQETEQEMAGLQKTLDNIAAIQADTASLKPKVDTLTAAKDGTTKWRVVLQAVSESIPDDTYLTSVRSSGTDDDTTITLDGVSESQAVVGDMMSRLTVHPLFDRVDLHYTQANAAVTAGQPADGGPSSVQFEVAVHLKGPAKPSSDPGKKGDK